MDTYLDEGISSPNGRYGIYDMGEGIFRLKPFFHFEFLHKREKLKSV